MNKTIGPDDRPLFAYRAEASTERDSTERPGPSGASPVASPPREAAIKSQASLDTLEGASDEPTFTKVVDRRWYLRNKHIYPASVWQEFDPEKDYRNEVRRDPGGNTFFSAK